MKTIIEEVKPVVPSKPIRLDAWRWNGVLGYDAYRAKVLADEAARAAKRAA